MLQRWSLHSHWKTVRLISAMWIERKCELFRIWPITVPEARVVRRNQVVAVRKPRDKRSNIRDEDENP